MNGYAPNKPFSPEGLVYYGATNCNSEHVVACIGMGQRERNPGMFWSQLHSVAREKKYSQHLGGFYSRTYNQLSTMRVIARHRYFQCFPLIACPEHNIFFCLFPPQGVLHPLCTDANRRGLRSLMLSRC